MTLWRRAQQLPQDALQALYNEFPLEVRHHLAPWLEEKIGQIQWQDVDKDNPAHAQYAISLVEQLIQEVESKAASIPDISSRFRLSEAAKMFRKMECMSSCMVDLQPDPPSEIDSQLEILHRRTQETNEELDQLKQEQEFFSIKYHENTKVIAHLSHLQSSTEAAQVMEIKNLEQQKANLEQVLNQKVKSIIDRRISISSKLKDTIELISALQKRIVDEELIKWKENQKLAGNGKQFQHNKLDEIQKWCEALANIIWHNRLQIQKCEMLQSNCRLNPPGGIDMFPILNQEITRLLSSLVTGTFVVEKNPPQVLKTNTRFGATVRHLVGGPLGLHMNPPHVKVSIISEAQATSLLQSEHVSILKNNCSGDIINNSGTMEYNQANQQLSLNFRNLQLRKVKRAEKKGTESVMDEKFALFFQSDFTIGSGELVFQVWTLSLPCVVIVHGNQEPQAWATVSWDNAFSEMGRIPFVVPDKVPWCQVADLLDTKFKYMTGRGLTEDNLLYLSGKALRDPSVTDPGKMLLSWSQFCKEPLPDRTFTFWEWFYAVMKVTREHLRQPWNDGSIMGFVGRSQAEAMLRSCESGTFIIRFSDSELGGVTIAWMFHDPNNPSSQKEVFSLQPDTAKDYSIRSMADRLADLTYLNYLYSNIPKDKAFGKYYSPSPESQPDSTSGYIKTTLSTRVPGWPNQGPADSTTPQSIMQAMEASNSPSSNFEMFMYDSGITFDTELDISQFPELFTDYPFQEDHE